MGEREMFLVFAAMFFFSMTSISANRFCLTNSEVVMESEFYYTAISLAQRIIEEAKTRAFDVSVETAPAIDPPNHFNSPYLLGRRSGEYYPNYSDVDDYHNMPPLVVNTPRMDYTITCEVYYVDEDDPDVKVLYQTCHKKLIVTVSSDYMLNDVKLSHVFSYYDFR